jgi:hypothetical protein
MGMRQELSLRDVCEVFKKYRLGSVEPEILKWYYRLKAKDDETIFNLQQYINRKIFNLSNSNLES